MKKSVHQNVSSAPKEIILIIDKNGVIGERLSAEYAKDYYVILVTNRPVKKVAKNVTLLKFKNKIPKAPKNDYLKILIIDNGEKELKSYTKSFVKETKYIETEIFFLINNKSNNIDFAKSLVEYADKLKILVLGDIFDDDIYFEKDSSITRFLKGVRKNKKIIVKNDGLETSYPISLDDTLKLIVKSTFVKASQKIILLFYSAPVTDMTLAHMFQQIDPDIDVDFKSIKFLSSFKPLEGSVHAIKSYSLKKKLSELSFDKKGGNEIVKSETKSSSSGPLKAFLLLLFLSLFILLLPYFTTFMYLNVGYSQVSSSNESASEGNLAEALEKSENAETLFSFAEKTNEIYIYQVELLRLDNYKDLFSNNIQNGQIISKSMTEYFKGLVLFDGVFTKQSADPTVELNQGIDALSNSYSLFQKANVNLQKDFENYIKSSYPFIEMVVGIEDILPSLMGVEKEMSYLVLFMDNTELMAGGGRVDAVGELRVRDFQITSFKILEVDELDESNNTNIESTYMIRRHLGDINSSLDYSGVYLDFVSNSQSAAEIYKQLTGEDIDGVIGIDLFFIHRLLEITGPLEIEGFDEVVTSDNFYKLILDNEGLLKIIVEKTIEEIGLMEKPPYYKLFQLIGESVPNKHIFIALRDDELQRTLTSNNLSNTLTDLRNKADNSLFDYFGIYEANLGRNQVNYFVSRSVEKINSIDSDGNFISELSIAFNNSSGKDSNFSKNYKNYIQIALPLGSSIDEVSVGGQRVEVIPAITDPGIYEAQGFQDPSELEIKQSVENGIAIFGFLTVIPPDSVKNIKINYQLPFNMTSLGDSANYSLKVFKQPGIDSYPFSMSFESNFYNIIPSEIISTEILTDTEFNYLISEK